MLRNERYVGVYEYGDVRIEGGVPAIITKETFDMAQEIIAKNARAPAASWSRVDYLLTGRLFCGKCGSPMVGESGTSKTGAKHNYYICATKKRRRACDKKTVRKEWIEELVVRETLQRVLVDDVIERIADAVVDLQRREQEEGEIPILQKQLAEVERSLKNVMTASRSSRSSAGRSPTGSRPSASRRRSSPGSRSSTGSRSSEAETRRIRPSSGR